MTMLNSKLKSLAPFSTLYLLLLFLNSVPSGFSASDVKVFSRNDFPPKPNFVFGSSTSAYQVEGAVDEDGRTPSIFDTFAHDKTWHQGNGDVACDGYHKYKEDIKLMAETGLDAYRFSISWSRLIPNGRGPVNPKGLTYYNNFINELINYGIEPHVTLLHVDLPQALEDEYGGVLSRRIVKDFKAYADVCFKEFGDRVLHWTTVNEANIFILGGYDFGRTPPKRCSAPFALDCRGGNSTTEPYIAAHNLLLAHASAVRVYRKKYQSRQHGTIGLNVFVYHSVPATNATEDLIAAKRSYDFLVGWFMDPLVYGDYPTIMKKNIGRRLPSFTEDESKLVKGSFDFIGVNHYTTLKVKDNPSSLNRDLRDFFIDMAALWIFEHDDSPWGGFTPMPWGLQALLEYFKQVYGNPPIYIHENGQLTERNKTLNDTSRVEYHQAYIASLLDAVRNGSNASGYFTWSFLDLFELLDGWRSSFGLYYVDLDDPNLTRYPKLSQQWYSRFLNGENVTVDEIARPEDDSFIYGHSSQ